MNNKFRMKQTEMGIFPEEWEVKKWGDLATLEYGKSFRDYSYSTGEYPVFGTNGQIGWSNEYLCHTDGVIIGRKGAYRGVRYSATPFFVIDTAFFLKPKEDFDIKWAYYELLSHNINSLDSGSAIPSTSRTDFYSIRVGIPPLKEQQNIGKILYDIDSKIELNQQMNKTLESIAQALFKHWFIDFEFPDENGQPYKSSGGEMVDSELGEIPQNWEIKRLDEVADFLNGLALQKYPAINENNYLPVIKIKEMNSGISESSDKASSDIPSEYIVDDGDILFAWSGSLGVSIWCNGKGALNQHLFKVTSLTYPKWFYYRWLLSYLPEFIDIARDKATTMGHIQRHHLSESLVAVPDTSTIAVMNDIFNPVMERIINLKIENKTLATIRDSLLPKLISGKIRVPLEDTDA